MHIFNKLFSIFQKWPTVEDQIEMLEVEAIDLAFGPCSPEVEAEIHALLDKIDELEASL